MIKRISANGHRALDHLVLIEGKPSFNILDSDGQRWTMEVHSEKPMQASLYLIGDGSILNGYAWMLAGRMSEDDYRHDMATDSVVTSVCDEFDRFYVCASGGELCPRCIIDKHEGSPWTGDRSRVPWWADVGIRGDYNRGFNRRYTLKQLIEQEPDF